MQKQTPRQAPSYSPRHHSESNVPRLSGKTVPPTCQDRNHLLGSQTQAFLPRSRAQLIHTDSPSPAAWSCLQPLSLEASPYLGGCQQSHQHLQKTGGGGGYRQPSPAPSPASGGTPLS